MNTFSPSDFIDWSVEEWAFDAFDPAQLRDKLGKWTATGADRNKAFRELASLQRDKPESAMTRVQFGNGGGILNPAVEHIGDLTHRMSEMAEHNRFGYETVKDKVESNLKRLKKAGGLGFELEHNENVQNNAQYRKMSPKDLHAKVNDLLGKYADEHAKLPVYNEAQHHAREAAVHLGRKNFGKTVEHLEELKKHLGSREEWDKYAGEWTGKQYKPMAQDWAFDVWNEQDHPRHPKGTIEGKGGKFKEKGSTSILGVKPPRQVAGMIFVNEKGEWLFLRRSGTNFAGYWSFPGGSIDLKEGETPEQAAIREAEEEVQHKAANVEFLQQITNEKIDYHAFKANVKESFDPTLNWEHDAFVWMKPEDILKKASTGDFDLHPGVMDLLKALHIAKVDKDQKDSPELHPELVPSGGDEWNKRIAAKLEKEYQEAKPALDKLISEGLTVGGPKETTYTEPSDPDEDEEPEVYYPTSWEEMSQEKQDEVMEKWKSNNYSNFYDSEVQSWSESGNPLESAKNDLADLFNSNKPSDKEFEWAEDAIKEWFEEREPAKPDPTSPIPLEPEEPPKPIPFTATDLLDALKVKYEGHGEGMQDPDIEFDDDMLNSMVMKKEDEPQFAGFEDIQPAKLLDEDMRADLIAALVKAFNDKAEKKSYDIEPPEYLKEGVDEQLDDYWGQMEDTQKFQYADDYNMVPKPDDPPDANTPPVPITQIALPHRFDPTNETNGEDYKKTQAIARYLSIERAIKVIRERGIKTGIMTNDAGLRSALTAFDSKLWHAWKGSSTSFEGKLLQLATANELGGRFRSPGRPGSPYDVAGAMAEADRQFPNIGGFQGIRAYLRAKWETTQYLLDKAGLNTVEVYRGIGMDVPKDEKTEEVGVPSVYADFDKYTRLPDLFVERNGAASTSMARSVSNGWGGDTNRVVLRINAPRTAFISVPAYGINVYSERELVIAGTAWNKWDAYKRSAPSFEAVPIGEGFKPPPVAHEKDFSIRFDKDKSNFGVYLTNPDTGKTTVHGHFSVKQSAEDFVKNYVKMSGGTSLTPAQKASNEYPFTITLNKADNKYVVEKFNPATKQVFKHADFSTKAAAESYVDDYIKMYGGNKSEPYVTPAKALLNHFIQKTVAENDTSDDIGEDYEKTWSLAKQAQTVSNWMYNLKNNPKFVHQSLDILAGKGVGDLGSVISKVTNPYLHSHMQNVIDAATAMVKPKPKPPMEPVQPSGASTDKEGHWNVIYPHQASNNTDYYQVVHTYKPSPDTIKQAVHGEFHTADQASEYIKNYNAGKAVSSTGEPLSMADNHAKVLLDKAIIKNVKQGTTSNWGGPHYYLTTDAWPLEYQAHVVANWSFHAQNDPSVVVGNLQVIKGNVSKKVTDPYLHSKVEKIIADAEAPSIPLSTPAPGYTKIKDVMQKHGFKYNLAASSEHAHYDNPDMGLSINLHDDGGWFVYTHKGGNFLDSGTGTEKLDKFLSTKVH
jgi:8-oxo-dGTP pyrophosphatase MutT (NUDIX family)